MSRPADDNFELSLLNYTDRQEALVQRQIYYALISSNISHNNWHSLINIENYKAETQYNNTEFLKVGRESCFLFYKRFPKKRVIFLFVWVNCGSMIDGLGVEWKEQNEKIQYTSDGNFDRSSARCFGKSSIN